MQVTEFPGCCGFICVNKFKGGHPGSNPDDCETPEEVYKYLQEQEKKYFNLRAGLLAVLSEPQNERVGHVFLDRRWTLLTKRSGLMNPRTGTNIYMYFRDLNYTETREKRIFRGKHAKG